MMKSMRINFKGGNYFIIILIMFLSVLLYKPVIPESPTVSNQTSFQSTNTISKLQRTKIGSNLIDLFSNPNTNNTTNYIEPFGIQTDNDGNIYVTGYYEIGPSTINVFAVKMDTKGNILFKVHFGGSGTDIPRALVVDSNHNMYIVGYTDSPDFYTLHAFHPKTFGGYEIFLTKISSTGEIVFSTYLGSIGNDYCRGMSLNKDNQLVLACYTNSPLTSTDQLDYATTNTSRISPVYNPLVYLVNLNGTPITDKVFPEPISYKSQGMALDNSSNIVIVGGIYTTSHYSSFIKIISGTNLTVIKYIKIY